MTPPARRESAPSTHLKPQASSVRFGEFFRYHGWLAPGVRLFRRIGFRAKALWIALAFTAPLALLLALLLSGTREQVAFADSERQGLTYVRPALDLLKAAQERRVAAMTAGANLAGLQDEVKAAFDKVQARQGEFGKAFGTTEQFAALLKSHQGLLQSAVGATPDETFRLHDDFTAAVLDLVSQVSDGSQLALDPDLDTYHMMNLSVLRGPLQYENTARLQVLGTFVLASQELTPQRRERLSNWGAVWELLDKDVENSYHEGIEADPEVARQFDMKGTDAAAQALFAALRKQVLGGEPGGDPTAFAALGRQAVAKEVELDRQVMDRLDARLQARIDRLWAAFYQELGMAATFIAIAAYLMMAFYKVMMGGLQNVSGHLREIAQGNLTTAPQPWGRDEAAQLMVDLREMQTSLRAMVLRVRHSSEEIVHTSSEIASGAMDLSARTEQTAANLEESASSMEEIGSTVKSTAQHTEEASRVAQHNCETAVLGGQAMREMVETMEGISASSSRIGEITATIDGIAFQTNILALNAAVEAARAGESGRGFAVVASEVRTLAQRSAEAAREIKTLIGRSVEQVAAGTAVVRRAGATIEDIVGSSRHLDQLLGEITTSAREQSLGVGQIGQAVNELDRMTQQNAALVEQTAAAASAMKDQAGNLAQEVARFRIPADAALAPAAAPASVADFDFDKAIEAHRQWKVKLRKAIADHARLDAETICRDDQCPLGKWLHGPGGSRWGSTPGFAELTSRHADFHQVAGAVARTINAGQFTDAERLIGSGSRFAQVSAEVATLLTRAKRGL